MALSGPQQEQLVKAFLNAFPKYADLKYIVKIKLSEDLETIIPGGGSQRDCIFEVISWVESRARLKEFLYGALQVNSTNPLLQRCGIDFDVITAPHSLDLPPLVRIDEGASIVPREVLFTYREVVMEALPSDFYREEIIIAATDASSRGIYGRSFYGIVSIETFTLDKGIQQWPVRLLVDERINAGKMLINEQFGERSGLLSAGRRSWFIKEVKETEPLKEIVFVLMVEPGRIDDEIQTLRRQCKDIFFQRPLLVERNDSLDNLSFPVHGHAYFNVHAMQPSLTDFEPGTLFVLDERTNIQILVSHNKSAVDMVVLVDVSGSMTTRDYVGEDNRPHTRLDGVLVALEILFQRRLISGSRVSRLALLVFGKNTGILYPPHGGLEELRGGGIEKIAEIRTTLRRRLSRDGLRELKIDRGRTKISTALSDAADLFNRHHQEGTEKVLILLSDGADWDDKTDEPLYGEIVSSAEDPAVLADSLYFISKIRIHTVAISNEEAYRRYCDDLSDDAVRSSIPNTPLLRKIAELAGGIFFESPDAKKLSRLFDELGRGVTYPLT